MLNYRLGSILIFLLLCICDLHADYYSAVTTLEDLFEAEGFMVDVFEKYMAAERRKQLYLENYIKQVEIDLIYALNNSIGFYGNPLNAVRVIKRFTRDWDNYLDYNIKQSNEEAYNESLKALEQHEFKRPNWDDMYGAVKGITRLQHVYKLPTTELANGTVQGIKASSEMNAADCFNFGACLGHLKDYKRATSWLLEARARLGQEQAFQSPIIHFPPITDAQILRHLIPCAMHSGNTKLGYWLAREFYEKEPEDAKAIENWNYARKVMKTERNTISEKSLWPVLTAEIDTNNIDDITEIKEEETHEENDSGAENETDSDDDEEESDYYVGVKENENYAADNDYDDDDDDESDEDDYEEELPELNETDNQLKQLNDNKQLQLNGSLKKPHKIDHLKGSDGKVPSMMELYEQTCRGDLKKTPKELRPLRCRYADNKVPFCQLARFKVEELNLDPYMAIYYNVIYDKEIDSIINYAEENVERSRVGTEKENSTVSDIRTSKNTWLWYNEHAFLKPIHQRLHDITGLNLESAEPLQVANYGIGGHYGPHYDFSEEAGFDFGGRGNRVLTALFYINEVKLGGSTAFPYLRMAVPPVRGSLVMWYNMHSSMELDYRTKHAACPVLLGSKWICNEWFHIAGQELHRPCGLESEGYRSIKYKEIER